MEITTINFITETYTQELAQTLSKLLELFDSFEYPIEPSIDSLLLTADNRSAEDTADQFLKLIVDATDDILERHLIWFEGEAIPLWKRYEILHALWQIQEITDYTFIARILEADMDEHEQLAEILSQLCSLSPSDILAMTTLDDTSVLDKLRTYIDSKTTDSANDELMTDKDELLANLIRFKAYIGNDEPVGIRLFDAGVLLNQTLKEYLTLTPIHTDLPVDQLAQHILSILYLTVEGYRDPVSLYRAHSQLFLETMDEITKCDIALVKLVNDYLGVSAS